MNWCVLAASAALTMAFLSRFSTVSGVHDNVTLIIASPALTEVVDRVVRGGLWGLENITARSARHTTSETKEQAQRILDLIMQHMNGIV